MNHTCRGCSTIWTGSVMCHCSARDCHRTFSSPKTFDRHRRGGQCQDPATLTQGKDGKPAMRQNDRGVWVGANEKPLDLLMEEDLSGCAYWLFVNGKGPRASCSNGCWQEPACITDEPIDGWPSQRKLSTPVNEGGPSTG
ncbi:hypothetical protein [Umezawaea sp. NPDC059074]|uniref:FDXHR family putative zinc-binding protein n=1 Tax=Umezawaea sp. NPDC059074 TaxID=3346716 RepID=UPI00369544B6